MEERGKNWLAAMLACWMFGFLGMHRFYTGQKGSAVVMLILTLLICTMPISAIWALIDGVSLAVGNYRHADGSELVERYTWVGVVYIIFAVLGVIYTLLNFTFLAAAIGGGMSGS